MPTSTIDDLAKCLPSLQLLNAYGATVASFSRRSTMRGATEKRSAISDTVLPVKLRA